MKLLSVVYTLYVMTKSLDGFTSVKDSHKFWLKQHQYHGSSIARYFFIFFHNKNLEDNNDHMFISNHISPSLGAVEVASSSCLYSR